MRGGRPAGRILLVVALVALPLVGLALAVAAGSPATPAAPRDAVLRVAPGQGSDVQAVRSGPQADPGVRGATGARDLGLLGVLLGAATALALRMAEASPPRAVARVRPGRLGAAAGRGPPHLLD